MRRETSDRSAVVRGWLIVALAVGSLAAIGASRAPLFDPGLTFSLTVNTKLPVANGPTRPGAGARRARGAAAPAGSVPTERVVLATGRATAGATRIDFLSTSGMPANVAGTDYVLVLDSNRTVIVHSAAKTYTQGSPIFGGVAELTGILEIGGGRAEAFAGTAYRARAGRGGAQNPPVERDGSIKFENLGAGDMIGGRGTSHYRITTQVAIANQADSAQLIMEVWSAVLPVRITNPFDLMNAGSGLGGSLHAYYTKLAAVTKKIEGVPLMTLTTLATPATPTSLATLDTLQRTMITSIKAADVDPSALTIPVGFTRAPGGG